jgi:hypothetical protein
MTMTSAGPSLGADGVQFTPEVIEEIKDLVAKEVSRDDGADHRSQHREGEGEDGGAALSFEVG